MGVGESIRSSNRRWTEREKLLVVGLGLAAACSAMYLFAGIYMMNCDFLSSSSQGGPPPRIEVGLFPPGEEGEFVLTKVSVGEEPGTTTVHLDWNCSRVSILTTEEQADSIRAGIEKSIQPRPSTHDLMADSFIDFGISVLGAKIVGGGGEADHDDGGAAAYRATLVLRRGNNKKFLVLDSTPSDAIAIASRFDAPVLVRRDLLLPLPPTSVMLDLRTSLQ